MMTWKLRLEVASWRLGEWYEGVDFGFAPRACVVAIAAIPVLRILGVA